MKHLLALLFCLMCSHQALGVVESYPFNTDAERKRYHQFIDELRCPKCQNQNLAGSNSPIAKDLRKQLHRLIDADANDEEIIDFMVSRYGDFVLYDPPFNYKTMVLWLGPLALLLIGLMFAFVVIRQAQAKQTLDEIDPDELAKIQRQLNGQDEH